MDRDVKYGIAEELPQSNSKKDLFSGLALVHIHMEAEINYNNFIV